MIHVSFLSFHTQDLCSLFKYYHTIHTSKHPFNLFASLLSIIPGTAFASLKYFVVQYISVTSFSNKLGGGFQLR